jgi:hypothetical protein
LRVAEQRIVQVSGVDADGKPVFEPFEHTSAVEREGKKPAAPKVKPGPRPNGEY